MPQPDTAINLDALFDAITASISAAVPGFQRVEVYDPEGDRLDIETPACLIDLVELEPTDNPGTEQLAAVAHFEAMILISFRATSAKREIVKRAAAVALHAQGQRWGMPVEPATVTAIAPSDFRPELDQFEVWAVEWRQTIQIGESIWNDDGTPPTQVLASWSPEIGPDHEGDYTEVAGGAAP